MTEIKIGSLVEDLKSVDLNDNDKSIRESSCEELEKSEKNAIWIPKYQISTSSGNSSKNTHDTGRSKKEESPSYDEERSQKKEISGEENEVWIPKYQTSTSSGNPAKNTHDTEGSKKQESPSYDEDRSQKKETSGDGFQEEKKDLKKQAIKLYESLNDFLESDDFKEDLRNELQNSNRDYLKILKIRRENMAKCDHGIVIAGETSAGKSTLLNKILGKKIFQPRNLESTSTICKIRNSEQLKIITEKMTGDKEEIDVSHISDIETSQGEKQLREILFKLTDKTSSTESMKYRSVDIGFPIPMLQGNVVLVDTPGIGATAEITQKLKEYIPNAVSFIFVITVVNAGGMQEDRLPDILKSILEQRLDEMPCFDPKDAVFITNKWDAIKTDAEDDSNDEDERIKTWENLKSRIKNLWPEVKDKNIFRLNLREVSKEKENKSTMEFEDFRRTLTNNIQKADNIRIVKHLRFVQEILVVIYKGLVARLRLHEIEEGKQRLMAELHRTWIKELTEKNKQFQESIHEKIQTTIKHLAEQYCSNMSTEEGKNEILNPKGRIPILKDSWIPGEFDDKVRSRVQMHLRSFLRSKGVSDMFKNITKDLEKFTNDAKIVFSKIESDWLVEKNAEIQDFFHEYECLAQLRILQHVLKHQQDEESAVVASFGIFFNIAFAFTSFALLPISAPIMLLLDREDRKKKLIDSEYEKCKSAMLSNIRKILDDSCGLLLRNMLQKVTCVFIPSRIAYLQKLEKQLLESRGEILRNRDLFLRLEKKVVKIKECATFLLKDLGKNPQEEELD